MTPTVNLLHGDALDTLRTLPTGSVHAVVTSPPYWNLRDYRGERRQIGIEASVDAYVARLVDVFREARRVLRKDGNLFVNLGDTHKNKNLVGVPWRVALALQADGWKLRTDIIWDKPNVTPESCRDRVTRSHEYLFHLTPRARGYYWDQDILREPNVSRPASGSRGGDGDYRKAQTGAWAQNPNVKGGFTCYNARGRNKRSVWRIPTRSFRPETVGVTDVVHFAVMPLDLARPCVLAGTPSGGVCGQCGAPQRFVLADREDLDDVWAPTCACPPGPVAPAVVLDPFAGSGTVGVVAREEGRSFVGLDLSADYLRLARARIEHAVLSVSVPR